MLFENAGVDVKNISDILGLGIYMTTAVKTPKTGYTIDPDVLKAQLPLLEAEIKLSMHAAEGRRLNLTGSCADPLLFYA